MAVRHGCFTLPAVQAVYGCTEGNNEWHGAGSSLWHNTLRDHHA